MVKKEETDIMENNFNDKVEELVNKDPRYKVDAYEFTMEALHFTQRKLNRKGHITGKELSVGIKEYALEKFGPMARTVFEHWGISKTDDFGEIVFNMIESSLMSKTDKDSKEDFKGVYDFEEAFDLWDKLKPEK